MITGNDNTLTASLFAEKLGNAAFAFRGYNVQNLGRSRELLVHPTYAGIVTEELGRASRLCEEVAGRPVDLIRRVTEEQETTLESYDEAISLIMAMEVAQLRILRECFGINDQGAALSMGYSLGELSAVVASGLLPYEETLRVPLELAADCVALAHDTTLGVLFSRSGMLNLDAIRKLCLEINTEGKGVAGISAILSPNSVLLMGQGETLPTFKERMYESVSHEIALRLHRERWPPLHTPLVWAKNIPNRAAYMMHTIPGGFRAPTPRILSLVTGEVSYNEFNVRETLHRWVDHPQRLWDAVYRLMVMGIDTVIHVGPAPNIMPATFQRLSDNVSAQIRGNVGVRALSRIASRPWLKSVLPQRTALLRAPQIQHIILEDWLLSHSPAPATQVPIPELPSVTPETPSASSSDATSRD
jgi:[acyl-carrier-protein] S-malonyltransferase